MDPQQPARPASNAREPTVDIYVIVCDRDKYYVGKSACGDKRIMAHMNGNGGQWTQRYRPIARGYVVETVPTKYGSTVETSVTLQYMAKYGIYNVRGGPWTARYLSKDTVREIRKLIRHEGDQCFRCGEAGHVVSDCAQGSPPTTTTSTTTNTTTNSTTNTTTTSTGGVGVGGANAPQPPPATTTTTTATATSTATSGGDVEPHTNSASTSSDPSTATSSSATATTPSARTGAEEPEALASAASSGPLRAAANAVASAVATVQAKTGLSVPTMTFLLASAVGVVGFVSALVAESAEPTSSSTSSRKRRRSTCGETYVPRERAMRPRRNGK